VVADLATAAKRCFALVVFMDMLLVALDSAARVPEAKDGRTLGGLLPWGLFFEPWRGRAIMRNKPEVELR